MPDVEPQFARLGARSEGGEVARELAEHHAWQVAGGWDGTSVSVFTRDVNFRVAMQKHSVGRVVLYACLPNVSWVYAVAFSAAFHM